MRRLWSILALILALPVAAEVFEAHDKWPERRAVTQQAAVPEPATLPMLMLGLGVLGVYVVTKKRRK